MIKNIFITGGTGSFGKSFIKYYIKNYKFNKLVVFSRDELKQFELMDELSKFSPKKFKNIRFLLGDIRDKDRLSFALNQNIDLVVHAAALKHVTLAEYNPFEFVKTNVIGSQNIIEESIKNNVAKVIALSTDKASSPINLYGATKLTADKMFIAANNLKGNKNTIFSVVRYGNVLGSRGSVLPIFLNSKSNNFNITHEDMTRFLITLKEGVKFVIQSIRLMKGGEIFIPKLPSVKLLDIANAVNKNAKHKFIGIRQGEKLHEEMISNEESINCIEFKNFYILLSGSGSYGVDVNEYIKKYKIKNYKLITDNFKYSSNLNSKFLTVKQISNLIKEFRK